MSTPSTSTSSQAGATDKWWAEYLRANKVAVRIVEAELAKAAQKLAATQAKCDAGIQQLTQLQAQLTEKRDKAIEKQTASIEAYATMLKGLGKNLATNALYQQAQRNGFGKATLINKAKYAASDLSSQASSSLSQKVANLRLQNKTSAAVSGLSQKVSNLKLQNKASGIAGKLIAKR